MIGRGHEINLGEGEVQGGFVRVGTREMIARHVPATAGGYQRVCVKLDRGEDLWVVGQRDSLRAVRNRSEPDPGDPSRSLGYAAQRWQLRTTCFALDTTAAPDDRPILDDSAY